MKTAGIIGGLEFLGCHITLKFLAEDYHVKIPATDFHKSYTTPYIPGLLSNRNLKICETVGEDLSRLHQFVKDCDIIIHAGIPLELGTKIDGAKLFVPVIKGVGQLLKAIKKAPSVEKIIFLASPAIYSSFLNGSKPNKAENKKNKTSEKAMYHADRAIQNLLDDFADDFFEVIIVAPVEIKNNEIMGNTGTTSAGLQILFRNKTGQDPVLQKLFKRDILQTMVCPGDLPDIVFNYVMNDSPGIPKTAAWPIFKVSQKSNRQSFRQK